MKRDVTALDAGQLDLMWNFLRMGHQKPNIPALKELCDQLRQAMIQKDAGQFGMRGHINFADLGTIVNSIVIETMCLYLSGALDKLECPAAVQGKDVRNEKDSDSARLLETRVGENHSGACERIRMF